jgi:phage terminase large subunit
VALLVPRAFSDELMVRALQRQKRFETENSKAAARVAYPDDPVGFFRNVLGWEPWSFQRQLANSVLERRNVYARKCHASGGTALMARLALWFLYAFPDDSVTVLTTAPTGRQVSELLWRELRAAWHGSKVALPGRLYEGRDKLNLSGSQYILGFAAKHPSGVPGFHAKRVLLLKDEAAGMDETINEALESALAGGETVRKIEMSQPLRATGAFYNAFNKDARLNAGGLFTISYDQTPNFTGEMNNSSLISPEWVDEKAQQWGVDSAVYGVRVLAKFPPLGARQLISPDWCERMKTRPPEAIESGPLVIGVDVAGLGRNTTVIYPRAGNWFFAPVPLQQQDPMTVAGYVVQCYRKWLPRVIAIDSTGIGSGVYYAVCESLKPEIRSGAVRVVPLIVGGKARNQRDYENMGSELYARIAQKMRDGELGGHMDDETQQDLIQVQAYPADKSGKLKVDKYGETDNSPDYGDAFVYTEAATMALGHTTAKLGTVA